MRRCIYCGWKIRDNRSSCDNCDMIHLEENNRLYPGADSPFLKSESDKYIYKPLPFPERRKRQR